ncbi:L-lactate dehydrogenase complex protein LldG [Marinobacter daqiaonensis]|uniref:L-lactate dehydrogenase complex protein LldG n=1 Tax=Marinobacter daqiaonensis TaxID=650891 RepID=A0A1I6HLQ9_9GAMM|nr:lactate utilization protein [Marinobacter daqiaonensis]SFR55409.1 L-lactate dehydrogenase complex protein LldG [Marinobacter daqiaonensis]
MSARDAILNRLRHRSGGELTAPARDFSVLERPQWSTGEKVRRFREAIEPVHGEVHQCPADNWIDCLAEILAQKGTRKLLVGNAGDPGDSLRQAQRGDLPELMIYDEPISSWQAHLFEEVDASLTSTRGGIAETGSLILWPTVAEPRLMSLVPPVHIALLRADQLYTTLHEAIREQDWSAGMPTNALLVSGPSKTADIEQTLAYGVHGPKELIVLILE